MRQGMQNDACKETAVARGRRAEALAKTYLVHVGYNLIACNYRGANGEIDLIGWDAAILCFIEVRARADDRYGDPLETINQRKIQRIVRAAWHFLETLPTPWPEMRFDALGILLSDPPTYTLVRAAFEAV